MARPRSPDRDKAYALWLGDRTRPLKDIAAELGVSEEQVRKWKSVDKWENDLVTLPFKSNVTKRLVQAVEQNDKLTEKEKAFCLHFVKAFNAAAAARAAGYESKWAARIGWELLQKPHIKAEVQRLKEIRNLAMMAGPDDVVELHMRIAFGDVGDFVEWGRTEVPVMAMFGPVEVEVEDSETGEKKKVPLMKEVNDVRFRESSDVDGQLVQKVKLGKDGASIELVDRHKSLAFLERWFELNPMDKHKKAFDEAKLALEQQRAQKEIEPPAHDDGFMEAMKATAGEVWTDEDSGDVPV